MGDIFLKLLNMSITAGWLILAVLCIRLLFKKIPKWVSCLLWGAVALRLICPFSIESPFSMLPSTEPIKTSAVVEGEVQDQIPSIDSRLNVVEHTINPMLTETFAYDRSEGVAPLQIVANAAGVVWCCGMALLMFCAGISAVRLHRLVREAVNIRDNIYICDAVASPFILGLVKPKVYLSSALQDGETDCIIAHESAHLKRRDHWWKALGYFLLCIYWFQPLCWIAYLLFCRDIELACDEKAAKEMTLDEKKEYSKVLLSCARPRRLILSCPLAFGEVGVKERVKSVLNYKKPTFWVIIASFAIVVVLAAAFLTNPAKEYQIRITIPAGSTETICYSDEEISPKGNSVTFYAGEGLGDAAIELEPVEVREENAYDEPIYITPGMPVKVNAEKGGWFRVGVYKLNPTEEDIDVYVSVRNVDVRIAASNMTEENGPSSELASDQQTEIQQEIALNDDESENVLTMDLLLELFENDGLASKAREEGLAGFLAYENMKLYPDVAETLTGLYTCDLVYPYTPEKGKTELRNYELQLSYWKPETAEEYGYAGNEINDIRIMEKETMDAVLLYEVDERFTPTNDLRGFLQRDYGIGQYLACDLPDGFTLNGFQSGVAFAGGGWMLEGTVQEPPHGDGAPADWYCTGGIEKGEHASQLLRFENGVLTDIDWRMNHMEQVGETKILDGCETQAVLAEYAFELFTPPEWEEYVSKHPGNVEDISKSRYWYVFMGEADSENYYVLFLNQEYFTKEDIIRMARSVRFTEGAF